MSENNGAIAHEHIDGVRRFNRFYTNLLGLLDERLPATETTLTEARVLWEIEHAPGCTASDLIKTLRVDRGYLSRILDRFTKRGLVARAPQAKDRRVKELSLTSDGLALIARLKEKSNAQVSELLGALDDNERAELAWAMGRVRSLLGQAAASADDGS